VAPLARQVDQIAKTRILLCDDHQEFLKFLRVFLEPTFCVVKCVEEGESLIEAAAQLKPDVIVTDISMPKLNGIEAVNRLRESGSSSTVVFLTAHADPDFIQAALKTGALAYVAKNRMKADLLLAIGEALAGRIFVSPVGPGV
jgi:DNA-binding NarL/FixJ family response regulator